MFFQNILKDLTFLKLQFSFGVSLFYSKIKLQLTKILKSALVKISRYLKDNYLQRIVIPRSVKKTVNGQVPKGLDLH